MARQTIDIGTNNNDGTGDKLRDAMRKVNQNFTELYGQSAAETNVNISGNSLSVQNTNGNLTLEPNGSGRLLVETGATFNNSEQPLGSFLVKAADGSDVINANVQYRSVIINEAIPGSSIASSPPGLYVGGDAKITGDVFANANIHLGASGSHTVTFNGKVNSNISASGDDQYDIGSPTTAFKTGYISNIESDNVTSTELTITNANIGNIITSGDNKIGNLLLRTNQIFNTVANQDMELKPSGTGNVKIDTKLVVGNILVGIGSDTGENVQIKNSTRFSSTFAIAQNTPSTPVGAAGNKAGMIAWDSSKFYVCVADYDGSTAIWKAASLTGWSP